MGAPRPLASLSSSLLARKGGARPAMRSQAFAPESVNAAGLSDAALNDLGWNDISVSAPPVDAAADTPPVPSVLIEREALANAVVAPAEVRTVSTATAARLRRETAHAGKAALTVRLDANRHLRLRLASAITNQSAQILLTQAIDALLHAMPTVEALVAQLPPAQATR